MTEHSRNGEIKRIFQAEQLDAQLDGVVEAICLEATQDTGLINAATRSYRVYSGDEFIGDNYTTFCGLLLRKYQLSHETDEGQRVYDKIRATIAEESE
jgi:hypothetical protein